jgi:cell pole-organizing protein PopZ
MSEQMNSVKIEDVLSSIRRLVSEEHRPKPRALRGMVPLAEAALADKLILTPSLRVAEAADPVEGDPPDAGMAAFAEPDAEAEAVIVDLAARLGGAAEPEAGVAEEVLAGQSGRDEDSLLSDPAPDVAEMDEAERVMVDAMPVVIEDAEVVAEVVAGAVVAEAGAAGQEGPAAGPAAEPAVPEFVHRARHGNENAAVAEGPPVAESTPADTAKAAEAEAESIDEETLREIVREVLREELQGMFGERITRNVRKLVRSEIARALSAQGIS